VAILTDQRPDLAVVDRGYRGHAETRTRVLISGTRRCLTPKLITDLRRRSKSPTFDAEAQSRPRSAT
jgi:transposase, IS5 family